MKKSPRTRKVLGAFAILALLAAGYAGMQLAPAIHATASTVSHGQQAIQCPSTTTHC